MTILLKLIVIVFGFNSLSTLPIEQIQSNYQQAASE